MIAPERMLQKDCGTSIRAVVTLSKKVKTKTETESEPITTKVFLEIDFEEFPDDPMTTGKIGKMHGAKIVSIPAKKDITKSIINYFT